MTTTATDNRTEAKRLFCQFTDSTGIIDRLYGPAQAPNRAAIVSALLGKRIPKSNPQAGWNRFRRGMLNLYDIDGSDLCHAEEDSLLADLVATTGKFIITGNGLTAWQWENPSNRVTFADISISVDEWKARMESKGFEVVDGRGQPCGNVWV